MDAVEFYHQLGQLVKGYRHRPHCKRELGVDTEKRMAHENGKKVVVCVDDKLSVVGWGLVVVIFAPVADYVDGYDAVRTSNLAEYKYLDDGADRSVDQRILVME